MNIVSIKSQDEKTAVVQGWGVIFDGEDLEGETFTKNTEFDLDYVPVKRVYYDHRQEAIKHHLGETKSVMFKEDGSISGLWVEAQLDRSKAYVDEVLRLVEKGILGWSSGSAGHLIDREGKTIKHWPILEFSLTPTPAEPRTLGVEELKQLAELNPKLKAFLPQKSGEDLSEAAKADDGVIQETHQNNNKGKTMTEEVKTPKVDVDAIKAAARQEYQAELEAEAQAKREMEAKIEEGVKARLSDEAALKDAGFVKAPAFNKTGLGDTEQKSIVHYMRTGDDGGLKASNDTDMNIGTAADGGNAVPTGHFQGIIARRDESMLAAKLGVRNIPGKGLTVNVPLDSEGDGEFISTGEATGFDRDAPALGKKAMTLAKYTKYMDISLELLEDEDSRLMSFIEDFVGRGMAKTHNSLLLTEVASNGTSFKTFANSSKIIFGEPEDVISNADLAPYLEDGNSVAWVMSNPTLWHIRQIVGTDRQYYANQDMTGQSLLGYPVHISQKAAAIASSAKSVYAGNWNFVGKREAPSFSFLRDPYSAARTGQVRLWYYFRTVYGVLQAEAVGYGAHPSS